MGPMVSSISMNTRGCWGPSGSPIGCPTPSADLSIFGYMFIYPVILVILFGCARDCINGLKQDWEVRKFAKQDYEARKFAKQT